MSRFLWYRDNNLSKDVIKYEMKVHIFACHHHLQVAEKEGASEHGADTLEFVEGQFNVDNRFFSEDQWLLLW